MNKLKTARIIVQITAFLFASVSLFLLSYPFKFITAKEFFLTSPSLLIFAYIAAQYITAAIFILTVFIALALLFGRVFCGWLCPYGAVMDFFAFLCRPFRKWRESAPSKGLMSKYYMLLGFFILAVLGFQFVWIFEPITIFSRFINLSFFPFVNAITDKFFQYMIINHNFGEGVYDALRNNIFDSRSIAFRYQFIFFLLFIIPVLAALYKKRFWCRYICPLGASLGILSVKPKFPLRKGSCSLNCGRCEQICRSNAIRHDGSYIPSECVMCMDCMASNCRQSIECRVKSEDNGSGKDKGITRKQFLFWGGGVLAAIYMFGRKAYGAGKKTNHPVIRPPGSMPENQFKEACVRCGNCMKVCITNGLQPVMLESGVDGIWTPEMDNIIGYCEYSCNACGRVCPTQAIKALSPEEKMQWRMGKAVIIKDRCVPWRDGIECLVCEEHCPVPNKAIKFVKEIINGMETEVPVVDLDLCIGCGVCENKCPVYGKPRGIVVEPL
ncbi:MAG: 4Fe-4S binding protein [Endomicrobia bacterium]|jgi:polyferredoxin|nr:4Fe-4S binding protein [Endomicrobiia bacterium]